MHCFPLEMGGSEEAEQLWTLSQPFFEAVTMAEPSLPFSLFCLNCEVAGIYLGLTDSVAAKATRAPFNGCALLDFPI